MTRYLALLRGINVGAANRIRMEELRRVLEEAGLSHVTTYIQSGNVFFSTELMEDAARAHIESTLKSAAGIETVVVLHTKQTLGEAICSQPFTQEEIDSAQRANTEGESFHVGLLPFAPSSEAIRKLDSAAKEGDACVVSGQAVYLLISRSIRLSKLALRAQRLFPEATFRNWNTLVKLYDLFEGEGQRP